MKAQEKLNEMLKTNYLTASSSDREAAQNLIKGQTVQLGRYSGRGRFTTAHVDSLNFLKGLAEWKEWNDAPQGGATGEHAELIKLNASAISEKYKQFKAERKAAANEKRAKATKARKEKAAKLKTIAKENNFESVAALKRANAKLEDENAKRLEAAKQGQIHAFEAETGEKYQDDKISHRVKASRMPFEFNRIETYF